MTYVERPTIHAIINAAGAYVGRTPDDLRGADRTKELALTRHAIAAAASRHGYSSTDIAAALGGRDHTTILHSRRRAGELQASSAWFRELLAAIEDATAPSPLPVVTAVERPSHELERLKRRIARLEYEMLQLKGARA